MSEIISSFEKRKNFIVSTYFFIEFLQHFTAQFNIFLDKIKYFYLKIHKCIQIYFENQNSEVMTIINHQHLPQESLRMEDDAVRLVGSGGYHLLRAVKTW